MDKPICPIHNKEMHLRRFSSSNDDGGFAQNYWYCAEKVEKLWNDVGNKACAELFPHMEGTTYEVPCNYTLPGRSREELDKNLD